MSTTILARLAEGRAIADDAFADITTAAVSIGWAGDGRLAVTFDADLTTDQRRAVRCRLISDTPAEEALMATIAALAAQTPTTAADRLTRVEQGLLAVVRLVLRDDS